MSTVSNDFTATGAGTGLTMAKTGGTQARSGKIWLSGDGVCTVQLERRKPGDVAWFPIFAAGEQLYVWSYNTAAFSEDFEESEDGNEYRLRVTAYTSGTLTGRLSN